MLDGRCASMAHAGFRRPFQGLRSRLVRHTVRKIRHFTVDKIRAAAIAESRSLGAPVASPRHREIPDTHLRRWLKCDSK